MSDDEILLDDLPPDEAPERKKKKSLFATVLPKRARLNLFITVAVIVLLITLYIKLRTGDDLENATGQSTVNLSPKDMPVRAGMGDHSEYADDSIIVKQHEKGKQARRDAVINGTGEQGAYFGDDIIDPDELDKLDNTNKQKVPFKPVPNASERSKADANALIKKIQNKAKEKNPAYRANQRVARYNFDPRLFMQQENQRVNQQVAGVSQAIASTLSAQNKVGRFTIQDTPLPAKPESEVGAATPNETEQANTLTHADVYSIAIGQRLYAILETPINSDEPGPVTALIIEPGPLEKTRIIGEFSRSGEAVYIKWNGFTFHGKDYGMNAITVDPETERTLLADDVDTHFLERWGGLIAASVVEGYAGALTNKTQTQNPDGSVVTNTAPITDAADLITVGIGKAGQRAAPLLASKIAKPPTVYVSGNREIGILFLQSLKVEL